MSSGLLTRGPATRRAPAVPMDPRVQARRVEVARDQGRRRRRRLLGVFAVLLVAGGAWGITQSPLMAVDQVAVSGAARSGDAAVRQAAGISKGRPVVSVDEAAAEARVEALPWVASAQVTSKLPHAVRIRVTEREPVAVAGGGPAAVLVDRTGQALGPAGDARLPEVVTDKVPAPGEQLADNSREAVAVLASLPPELGEQVATVERHRSSLLLTLHDGIEVELGDGTRLQAKSDAAVALLEQAGRDTIATIDVSVPGTAALTRSEAAGA
ncbi:MAG: FtsQ-type POTRA domain-containing protein [Actinobacteria bacterium]|nr:FtsQ-type POTRA domain-containing protein [Actinomycetota bacterium]